MKPGELPPHPVVGGSVHAGEILYIARGVTEKGKIPGNIRASSVEAQVSFKGEQKSTRDYAVLSNESGKHIKWVRTDGPQDPPHGAISGGTDVNGTTLYVGRALLADGHFIPGKINFNQGRCYIPYGGKEHEFTNDFYVLCQ